MKYNLEDLKAHAYVIQDENIKHEFTRNELIELKEQLFTISKYKMIRENILKSVADTLKGDFGEEEFIDMISSVDTSEIGEQGIKTLNTKFAALLSKINKGYEDVNTTLYGIDDQQEGTMTFYNEYGIVIYGRPLSPTERQSKITSLKVS